VIRYVKLVIHEGHYSVHNFCRGHKKGGEKKSESDQENMSKSECDGRERPATPKA